MSLIFNEDKATRAVRVFEALVKDKSIINSSSKALVIATAMAYLGKFTNKEISSYLGGVTDTISLLQSKGLLNSNSSSGTKTLTYTFVYNKLDLPSTRTLKDVSYLFVNALFNTKEYINKYGIKSWSALGLVLEAALKTGYSSDYVSLAPCDINSVTGKDFNKNTIRKYCVEAGFFQKRTSPTNRGHQYKLNKRAYLLGSGK